MGDNGLNGSGFHGGNGGRNRTNGVGGGTGGPPGGGSGGEGGGNMTGGGSTFDPQSSNSFRPTATGFPQPTGSFGAATTTFTTTTYVTSILNGPVSTSTSDGIAESPEPNGDILADKHATLIAAIVTGVFAFILIAVLIPIIIYLTKRYNKLRAHRRSIGGTLSRNEELPPPRSPKSNEQEGFREMQQSTRTSNQESFKDILNASLKGFKLELPAPPLEIHPSNRRPSVKTTRSTWLRRRSDESIDYYNPTGPINTETTDENNAAPLPSNKSTRSMSIYSNRSNDIFTSDYPLPMTKVPIFEEYSHLRGGVLVNNETRSARPVSYLSAYNPFREKEGGRRDSWTGWGRERDNWVESPRDAAWREMIKNYTGRIRPGMGVQRTMSDTEEGVENEIAEGKMEIKEVVPPSVMNRTVSGRSNGSRSKWVDRFR